jgi:conjugative transfer region protein TrbK
MRGCLPSISAAARAVGLVAVAAAIVVTAVHLRRDDDTAGAGAASAGIPAPSGPLTRELARCRAIGMASKDDADC